MCFGVQSQDPERTVHGMALQFNGSATPTLGVEMELQLIDSESGDLVQRATQILNDLGDPTWAKPELLQSTIEINTEICTSVEDVRRDLSAKIARVRKVCDQHSMSLVSAGTHPFSKWIDQKITPKDRYHRLVERIQWPARQLLIFGLHVHVGIPDGETAIAVINRLEPRLPYLLALTASSPFWEGHDTGLASARSKVFGSLPTAGLPYRHRNWREFEQLVESLVSAQAVESVREIWWDVRPHPGFGTVEVRICDALPTLQETVAMAALIQALVVHLQHQVADGTSPPLLHNRIVRENKWRALRWSTHGSTILDEQGHVEPIEKSIETLLRDLEPVFHELKSDAEINRVHKILEDEPSYYRQRAVFQETGSVGSVVEALTKELQEDQPCHV